MSALRISAIESFENADNVTVVLPSCVGNDWYVIPPFVTVAPGVPSVLTNETSPVAPDVSVHILVLYVPLICVGVGLTAAGIMPSSNDGSGPLMTEPGGMMCELLSASRAPFMSSGSVSFLSVPVHLSGLRPERKFQ